MHWSFTVIVYANIGSMKMKMTCALAVSFTVDRLNDIIFSSMFSTLGIFEDLKKLQKMTFSIFLANLEKHLKSETRIKISLIIYSISA